MLGSYAAIQAAERGWQTWASYSEHAVELSGCRTIPLDIRDPARVREAISNLRPDAVIHTAAMTRPDICEERKSDTFAVNTLGTRNIISAAESIGAHLVHLSTDLVFDGERNPYKTDAPHCPVNYYGETKALAEDAVFASGLDWAIVRTSIIYGPRMFPFLNSFSDRVIESLRAGKPMTAFTDQRRSPIPAWNLADACLEMAERRLTGIYHAACPSPSSRYEFALKIAEVFGLDAGVIEPISMDNVEAPARRPKTLALDTISTQAALNAHLLAFEEGVLELRKHMA